MYKINSSKQEAQEFGKNRLTAAELADVTVGGVVIGLFYKLCTVVYLITGSFIIRWNLTNSHKYHD